MTLPIYLAGPSHGLPRVLRYAALLGEIPNVTITLPWWETRQRYPHGDHTVPFRERRRLAEANLAGVVAARLVWILWPVSDASFGVGVELGAALLTRNASASWVMISGGDPNRCYFTALADAVFEEDDQALDAVRRLALEVRP